MNSSQSLEYIVGWLSKRCDGLWEHHNGIVLQTTDNPGWMIRLTSKDEFPRLNENVPVDVSTENCEGLISNDGLAMFSTSLENLLHDVVKLLKIRENEN